PQPVQAFLDAARVEPLDFLTVAEQRQFMRHASDLNYLRFGLRGEPVAAVTDHEVPVDGGTIRVRAYRPTAGAGRLPVHVFLHGGGWWLGSIDEYVNDALCRHRSNRARCVVLAVDYRLAPEYPFPTAIDDARAALRWARASADLLGVDPDIMSIGGHSAGGNIAAAVALACRDAGGPRLVFQLLEVPALDLTRAAVRSALETDDFQPLRLEAAEVDSAVRHYLPDPRHARTALASPVLAGDLAGLPPAHIVTAELDPLREEGERYARRLAEAGVPAGVRRCPRAIHATSFLTRTWRPAREWLDTAADVLRVAHQRADGTLTS
ncbi:MAG TPA: alpha/beta hydrolase, partial [Pseudonocardiaceae bacterium]|nr:alpha/beta hydrolase [Pseudonocardiaceae bacterium]